MPDPVTSGPGPSLEGLVGPSSSVASEREQGLGTHRPEASAYQLRAEVGGDPRLLPPFKASTDPDPNLTVSVPAGKVSLTS